MKKILISLAACLLFIAQPAYSIELHAAKAQGLVGETPSGYLAAVKPPSPEVKSLMETINAKRMQKYKQIAARNNTSLKAVEELAGKKSIEKTEAGGYIKQSGAWKKK